MNDPVVRVVGLTRDFGNVRALDGLSLDVPKETILILLGPNGAGKTTLLRVLMGMIEPTQGHAYVLGSDARSPSADQSGHVAYVGDRCDPPGWATAALLESVQAGASKSFDKTLFREFCKRRELPSNRPYNSLSKGQRRWLLTSLALACRPQVILLDEPSDGLDPAARRALYDALRDHVNQCATTAIVTTHVIADVERIGDEVAIIERGRLLFNAPLDDLKDRVRQVEIPSGHASSETGATYSVLGRVRIGTTDLLWIDRGGLSDDDLRERFGQNSTIRHVDLETLYLAITEHRGLAKTGTKGEIKQ